MSSRLAELCRRYAKTLYRTAFQPRLPEVVNETIIMTATLGYVPNIKRPRTFNEKIVYRKLLTRDPRLTVLADKWLVRDYVRDRVGTEYLTEIYQKVRDPAKLSIGDLPRTFVLKATHDCGSTIIIDDKASTKWDDVISELTRRVNSVFGKETYEYWYADIEPAVIAEARITESDNASPKEYKCFVFHGKVRYTEVFHGRGEARKHRFYDRNWRPLDVRHGRKSLAPLEAAPPQLGSIISVAETLGSGFDFVRVDLYAPGRSRVLFGEMTFAPAAGRKAFFPRQFDWELGRYW